MARPPGSGAACVRHGDAMHVFVEGEVVTGTGEGKHEYVLSIPVVDHMGGARGAETAEKHGSAGASPSQE